MNYQKELIEILGKFHSEIKHAEDSYMTQIVYALQIEHLINQAKQGEREKLLKLLINKGLLCPEDEAIKTGCYECKDFWRQFKTETNPVGFVDEH